jgi:hypothetical protein
MLRVLLFETTRSLAKPLENHAWGASNIAMSHWPRCWVRIAAAGGHACEASGHVEPAGMGDALMHMQPREHRESRQGGGEMDHLIL